MDNLIGRNLGRYHILEQLGEGGMATVFKAYDTRLESDVAVKVIRTDNLPPSGVEQALSRFEREAKALAKLTHPNIVPIIDYGEYEDSPYLVMKYLPGGTLKQMLKSQPMPWQEAAALLIPIARALDYAHRQGMIHRDVKPSNILITADGEPMLTDFGIAKIVDEEVTVDLTGTSATVGTPEYMAPEQVVSKTVDYRVDIYALGVVFYEMITGRRPFQADTPMAVLFKHASEPLPPPHQFTPNLPEVVEKVLFKALAKKPEDRYQSMGEFASALERLAYEKTVFPQPTQASLEQAATIITTGNNEKTLQADRALQQPLEPAARRKFSWAWLLLGLILVIALIGWFAWRFVNQHLLEISPAQVTNPPVPITLPTVTQTPAAPAPTSATTTIEPKILSKGSLEIPLTWIADLDKGVLLNSDQLAAGDIWFESTKSSEIYLSSFNNMSELALIGTDPPGFSGCRSANYSLYANGIPIKDMTEGTYICVHTNDLHYSQVRIEALDGTSPGTLSISFTTWETTP